MQVDHLGNEYRNRDEMLAEYGVSATVFYRRINSGMSLEQALTEPVRPPRHAITDHEGRTFGSVSAMAKHWDVPIKLVESRLKAGWSVEDTLTKPSQTARIVKDHLGNVYKDMKTMCEAYGITADIAKTRRKHGWSLKKTLTSPIEKIPKAYDHLGNEYDNFKAMAAAYGLPVHVIRRRLEDGMPLQTALTKPYAKRNMECEDHLGNKYKSFPDMCRHYGIDYKLAKQRISAHGWTLEETLTIPAGQPRCEEDWTIDPYGNRFLSESSMAEYYGVRIQKYFDRKRQGCILEERLGIMPILTIRQKTAVISDDLRILEGLNESNDFYLCSLSGHEIVLSKRQLADICLKEYQKKFTKASMQKGA